ncbi:MAG: YibE/F family protein [Lachnospiraceae bacterium]|nr:YibE/F family protein [Lachnospiraceae bacterium]
MILTLSIILFFLMVAVGGNRGLDSFFALVRTLLALLVNIYLIAWGMPPVFITVVISIFFVVTVIYSQNGRNAKMHAAAFSVLVVLIFILMTAGPVLWSAGISGYNEIEQYEEISMYLSPDLGVSMSAISLSAVLLGLLGAIMDTAVAITTAVNEVHVNQPLLTEKELFHSGLAVGKDILGTTVNTLFFAGLGESIMLAVLFMRNEDSFATILNSKALFQEVSGLLIGASGCLLIIPVSSLVCANFLMISEEKEEKNEKLLQNCYKYFEKLLKFVKDMLK